MFFHAKNNFKKQKVPQYQTLYLLYSYKYNISYSKI